MRWAIIISILLFIIPFFWLEPGQMDLGGDGSRLYYYDPLTYLTNDGYFLFDNVIEGIRTIEPHFFNIPFILLLALLKLIFVSPTLVIAIINGLKLSLSFLFVCLIVKDLLENSYRGKQNKKIIFAAILGGLFYISAPSIIGNYEKALLSQNQVFLNPLLFYLLLVYFLRQNFLYLVIAIVVSVIFSPNFAWAAAPPFFAFFPLAIIFLLIYIIFIKKIKINFLQIIWALLLLFGLHAFHLIPEIFSLLSPGSYANTRAFNESNILLQLNYFYGVLPLSFLSYNLFSFLPIKQFAWLGFIPLVTILFGFVFNKTINKTYLLTSIFFLVSLYLVTANITDSGVKLYESFFYIPGFSMFRNFIGQWAFIYSFFFALLFGQGLYIVIKGINDHRFTLVTIILISIALVAGSWNFYIGNMVNTVHFQSNNVKVPFKIDNNYEKTLSFISSLSKDAKFISFPFTDCCYTVVHGTDDGAYVGTSPITMLAGKKDYNGYIVIAPFSEVFVKLAQKKDYESIKKLLGILHISHIYYNSDPKVYEANFPGYPYGSMKQYFPKTQNEYKDFVSKISGEKIFGESTYHVYKVDGKYLSPQIFAANKLSLYKDNKNDWYGKNLSFFLNDYSHGTVYLEKNVCKDFLGKKECSVTAKDFKNIPRITFEKINPTKYLVNVENAEEPYVIALSETYHKNWNIYKLSNQKMNFLESLTLKAIVNENHALVNGYANGWYITPKDFDNQKEYKFIIEMSDQRFFTYGIFITLFTVIVGISVSLFLFRKKRL